MELVGQQADVFDIHGMRIAALDERFCREHTTISERAG
jgi:hypothetical protein